MVHGEIWTIKELFVYPNEYIYWSIQIVMYPFMTGLVAGAFVLSALYHVFGISQLKEMARFALVFSFALLFVAPMPLMLHLQFPERGVNVLMTPHFTSAIAAFGIVIMTYGCIVASELWFLYRKHFITVVLMLHQQQNKTMIERSKYVLFKALTLGTNDVSEGALHRDEKAVQILAGVGIPVACFLHGYAGFIFGSVKANALWMTPLMPVIFIMSAGVSGIALCMLTYIITMEIRKFLSRRRKEKKLSWQTRILSVDELRGIEFNEMQITSKYLLIFLIFSISLELLDLIFRGYTAVKSWDVLRSVIYGKDFVSIFILQYGIGNLIPLILFSLPRITIQRAVIGCFLVLLGVFMMRWNVVIGGQAFSLSFAGYMHYDIPIMPHDVETFKEGLFGALTVMAMPFILFWLISKIFPVFAEGEIG